MRSNAVAKLEHLAESSIIWAISKLYPRRSNFNFLIKLNFRTLKLTPSGFCELSKNYKWSIAELHWYIYFQMNCVRRESQYYSSLVIFIA